MGRDWSEVAQSFCWRSGRLQIRFLVYKVIDEAKQGLALRVAAASVATA